MLKRQVHLRRNKARERAGGGRRGEGILRGRARERVGQCRGAAAAAGLRGGGGVSRCALKRLKRMRRMGEVMSCVVHT
jgi:hypothetical protein